MPQRDEIRWILGLRLWSASVLVAHYSNAMYNIITQSDVGRHFDSVERLVKAIGQHQVDVYYLKGTIFKTKLLASFEAPLRFIGQNLKEYGSYEELFHIMAQAGIDDTIPMAADINTHFLYESNF